MGSGRSEMVSADGEPRVYAVLGGGVSARQKWYTDTSRYLEGMIVGPGTQKRSTSKEGRWGKGRESCLALSTKTSVVLTCTLGPADSGLLSPNNRKLPVGRL